MVVGRVLVINEKSYLRQPAQYNKYDKIIVSTENTIETPSDRIIYFEKYSEEFNFMQENLSVAHEILEEWKELIVYPVENSLKGRQLKYRGVSIIDSLFSNLQIYHVSRVLNIYNTVERLIEKLNPSQLDIYSIDGVVEKCIYTIASSQGIDTKIFNAKNRNTWNTYKLKILFQFGKNILESIYRWFVYLLKNIKIHYNVVFLSFNSRNLDTMVPVYNSLKNKKLNCCFLHIGQDGLERLVSEGIQHDRFEGVLSLKACYRLFKQSIFYDKYSNKLRNDAEYTSKFKISGVKSWLVFEEIVSYIYHSGAQSIVYNIELISTFIKRYSPKVFISSGDRNYFVRSINIYSKKLGIPTIQLQFGNIGGVSWNDPITSDIMCVESSWDLKFLSNIAGNNNKIIQTGQPRFEQMLSLENNSLKKYSSSKLVGVNSKKIVLFTSVPFIDGSSRGDASINRKEYIDLLNMFYSCVNDFQEIEFIVKPHPNETPVYHKKYINETGATNVKIVSNKVSGLELIGMCDLLITLYSTSGLEAVILGKPLLVINPTNREFPVNYVRENVALCVEKGMDLSSELRKGLYDKQTIVNLSNARKLYLNNFKINESPTSLISDIIIDLVNDTSSL